MKSTHKLEGSERGTIRTRKGTERARGTHVLWSTEGAAGQDTEVNRASGAHSPTGWHDGKERREKLRSGESVARTIRVPKESQHNKQNSRSVGKEGQVRTLKERVAGTHYLGSMREGQVRILKEGPSEGHLPAGERGGRTSQDTEKVNE